MGHPNVEIITSNPPLFPPSLLHHQLITYQAGNDLHQNVMTSRETGLSKYLKPHFVLRQLYQAGRFLY